MNEFLTWEYLGTFAGVVAAVTMIVQFLKLPMDRVWKIPTRFLVFIIALVLLFTVQYFTGEITADVAALTIINAVVVTMAALGTYEVTVKKLEQRKDPTHNKNPG